jgi:hypothetical protein
MMNNTGERPRFQGDENVICSIPKNVRLGNTTDKILTIARFIQPITAANVVAAMLVPAIHQGSLRPPKKKSVLLPARLDMRTPIERLNKKYKPMISQSIQTKLMPPDFRGRISHSQSSIDFLR